MHLYSLTMFFLVRSFRIKEKAAITKMAMTIPMKIPKSISLIEIDDDVPKFMVTS